jgi:anti-sigma factor ChrR (cupin superfamily)
VPSDASRPTTYPWRPSTMAPGVSVKDIAVTAGWEMQLVRFEPGARFPVHTHESARVPSSSSKRELVQAGRRLGRGWGETLPVRKCKTPMSTQEAGCVFVLVDRA